MAHHKGEDANSGACGPGLNHSTMANSGLGELLNTSSMSASDDNDSHFKDPLA